MMGIQNDASGWNLFPAGAVDSNVKMSIGSAV